MAILEEIAEIEPKLVARYEEWMGTNLEGKKLTHSPVPASNTPPDDSDMSLQHAQSKGKERERDLYGYQHRDQGKYSLPRPYSYIDDAGEVAPRPAISELERRPATIDELTERALEYPYDPNTPLKPDFGIVLRYRKDAREYYSKGDLDNAFISLTRASTLILEKFHNPCLSPYDVRNDLIEVCGFVYACLPHPTTHCCRNHGGSSSIYDARMASASQVQLMIGWRLPFSTKLLRKIDTLLDRIVGPYLLRTRSVYLHSFCLRKQKTKLAQP